MVTNSSSNIPTAASGKVLQGQGIGTANAFSTATYPATAGTSLNLLQSDGTNFVSTAPIILTASGNISSANWKLINSTPVTAIPSPGAGKSINIIGFSLRMNYGGTNAFTAGGAVALWFTNTSGQIIASLTNTVYTGTATTVGMAPTTSYSASTSSIAAPVILSATSNPGGNAAGDNTVDWFIAYYITF